MALNRIKGRAQRVDISGQWPTANLLDLRRCGALSWAIPREFGGEGLDPVLLHQRYEDLAAECLTTALILTQRDSAIGFLLAADERPISVRLLRSMARGSLFATIGIAQLTTSGQHLAASVIARRVSGGFLVSGRIPWATGASHAHRMIVGAALSDNHQILFALRVRQPGVIMQTRKDMVALNASCTGAVELKKVLVPDGDVLVQPCENALASRSRHRAFGLSTCVLPLGVARGALMMAREVSRLRQGDCHRAVESLRREYQQLSWEIYRRGKNPALLKPTERAARLRGLSNHLAQRSALAALELAKGRGFMLENPAQRRAREALFFFVWSSGTAVMEQTLNLLAHR